MNGKNTTISWEINHKISDSLVENTFVEKQENLLYEKEKIITYLKSKWIELLEWDIMNLFLEEINKLRLNYWISKEQTDKWITLTEETFFKDPIKMIDLFIDNFWFIPEELYTKMIFLTKNNFSLASKFFQILKNKEKNSKNAEAVNNMRKARNIFLKYIFLDKKWKKDNIIKWICSSIKKETWTQITLDTNWIFIKLFDGKDNIVSHFPYQFIDDELLNYWLENEWIDVNTFLEIKNRKLRINNDLTQLNKIEEKQIGILLDKLGISKNLQFDEKIKIISEKIISSPNILAKIIINNSLVIPDIIFNYIIENNTKNDAVYYLFNFAEQFNIIITKEDIINHNKDYLLAYKSKNRFTQRKKIANQDTRLYVCYKAIDKALSIDLPENWLDFYLLKSEIDSESNLWFVEVLSQRWVSRSLLNQKKHLSGKSKKNIHWLKMFSKSELENIEVFFNSFFIAKNALEKLKQNLVENKILFEENNDIFQEILIFILNYFPVHFQKLSNISKQLLANNDKSNMENFIKYTKIIFEKLRFSMDDCISKGQNLEVLENSLIKKSIHFDKDFLEKIKKLWLPDYCYDTELCTCWESINIVELKRKWNNESSSIDYFSELSAINALNLKQNKPIIIVSWWCKEVSANWISSLDIFSGAIINAWIRSNANLSIPWTQSWIWVSMSKQYLKYKSKSKFISDENSMRMFSISPRNNMADNDHKSSSKYAPCPIDHIYIPCWADWEKKWPDVINAEYFQFIEWAEQIYHRLDRKKNRLHVIWNWWLFTIAEANASLKNNGKLLLVEWTGRFADLSASILKSKDFWKIIMWLHSLNNYNDFYNLLLDIFNATKTDLSPDIFKEIIDKDLWDIPLLKEVFNSIWDKKIVSFEELFNDLNTKIEALWIWINPKQVLYMIYLVEFLKLSILLSNKPSSCKLEEMDSFLEKSL